MLLQSSLRILGVIYQAKKTIATQFFQLFFPLTINPKIGVKSYQVRQIHVMMREDRDADYLPTSVRFRKSMALRYIPAEFWHRSKIRRYRIIQG